LLAIRFSWHALLQRMGRIFPRRIGKKGRRRGSAPSDSIDSTVFEAALGLD
jgi:hypothetical protein